MKSFINVGKRSMGCLLVDVSINSAVFCVDCIQMVVPLFRYSMDQFQPTTNEGLQENGKRWRPDVAVVVLVRRSVDVFIRCQTCLAISGSI